MKKELAQLRERRMHTQGEPPSGVPREERTHVDRSEGRGDSFSSMEQEDATKERRNAREVRQHHINRPIDIIEAGPFAWNILQDPLPSTFTPVGFFYDGIGDPLDHMYRFKSIATLHLYTDGIRCRVFTTTLIKNAQLWFNSLPRGSITSFEDFSTKFLRNFSSSKKQQKTAMALFRLRQREREDLREYVKRFSAEKLEIPVTPPEILVSAFIQGLQDGDFFRSLAKRNASTFAELLERAEKYINLEECRRMKEGERSRDTGNSDKRIVRAPHKGNEQFRSNVRSLMEIQEEQPEAHYPPSARRHNQFPTSGGPRFKIGDPRFDRYTELALPKSVILERIAKHPKLRWPRGHSEPPRGTAVASGYCHFHNDYGHETNECFTLRDELERLVRLGALSEYVMEESSKGRRDSEKRRRDEEDEVEPIIKRGFISMIIGGPTDGDSNRARRYRLQTIKKAEVNQISVKAEAHPIISFGPHDCCALDTPHADALVITSNVAGYDVSRIFVDNGSSVNVLFHDCLQRMDLEVDVAPVSTMLYGFNGGSVRPLGQVKLTVSLGTAPLVKIKTVNFMVVDAPESSYNMIFGRPMINTFRAIPSTYHMKLKFPVGSEVGEVIGDQTSSRSCYVESVRQGEKSKRVRESQGGTIDGKKVRTNTAEATPIHTSTSEELIEVKVIPDRPECVTRIGSSLDGEMKEQLIGLLRDNSDVFAWKSEDLTGIDPSIMVHKLHINTKVRPVKQKKRHFGAIKDAIIKEEVDKLLQIGHIREIQFPEWLSNAVLVAKPGGKWRMCIDFRDLNAACPKDHYPLPRIDQLVDATAGCELLSMMDASQGYHQVRLDVIDQPKVSFITSGGTYCYQVMPFGLKNAGATYQRLVDKVFAKQLGRNLEVYVDDMLVKSREATSHIADLAETFLTLRRYGMKLNPAKCSFGVCTGKFLGYMVTKQGIEVNPEKVKAITTMTAPRTIKEVQTLAGKVVALSRFVSRLAEHSFPIFRALRKGKEFAWTKECQTSFENLKQVLSKLPSLSPPEEGETLCMYLAAGDESISSVLFREKDKKQLPVYYVSKILQGAELRYPEVEKVGLALITTARRLRPYFISHTIIVRTSYPLRQTLGNAEASGRMVKWAVELGQYNVEYEPRTAIKGQALVDFLQETTRIENSQPWEVYVDGSSTNQGAGAGVLLIKPNKEEFHFAIKFNVRASNNEAEYEALAQGLEIAQKMGIKKAKVHSDSQLVVQQLAGEYETKDVRMEAYVKVIKTLVEGFEECEIIQIPRESNSQADFLSKIGSSSVDCSERNITILSTCGRFFESNSEKLVARVEDQEDWRTPIITYLKGNTISDRRTRERIEYKARHFYLIGETLFKRLYSHVDARCLGSSEAEYVLKEVHEGWCSNHEGARTIVQKLLRAGYYWPTMKMEATQFVRQCPNCQAHAIVARQPGEPMKIISSPCPFAQWGIDLVGPFTMAVRRKRYLIVAVDYFTKWVEAEALSRITEDEVMKFIWKNICCRFGVPRIIISDNGTQFNGKKITGWCTEMKVAQRFTSVAHPQANGQVEVINRILVDGIKKRIEKAGGGWVEELDSVLWSYRTSPKRATGETPFSLVYGMEAIVPAEIGLESLRVREYDDRENEEMMREHLDLCYDKREAADLKMRDSKNRIKVSYDRKVNPRNFQIGDLVLRRADALKPTGKLEANWEGLYTVTKVAAGGAYELQDRKGKKIPRTWNVCHLRKFYA
ncbi:PREDICTED: uncharacterized protein LOC105957147 [Erythranthe guttata]|uniref:uncharacterized protein LOC105957147 n=1 Tax=Erythranthe guttata TaxID=4155 RepID=UPI00064DF1BA|nr:PREDICTED: uncharacterized protein LOC105957147 [Erythranthe guttata]|eukprot:XP_012836530.1 PREDICTED: uncharacterized protein LOC105957147 [Erythranthe guttata]